MSRAARGASHWAVAAAGVVLIGTAIAIGARDGFAFLDVVAQGNGHRRETEVIVVTLAALGAVTVFLWMRARAADRLDGHRRDG